MGRRTIITNGGNYFERDDDETDGDRTISLNGGNYTESIKGNFVQGDVITNGDSFSVETPARKPVDLSSDGDFFDVNTNESPTYW